MNCLADDTVHDFVHGQLAEVDRGRVDEHLDSCVECRSLIAALVHTNHDLGPQPGDPFSMRQGALVGRYMLLEIVGEGAMGVVFAAYDPELHRKVAVKLVRGSAGASSERLLREAQAMARLSHANVVTIYETGKVDDSVFIAMELVSGTTLREWLRAESRSAKEILSLILQAARGLQAAHGAGLVHRDFKPDNLLIADDGRARVTDFGLARGEAMEAGDSAAPMIALGSGELTQTMTRTGALLGTPAYMAPEQMRGEEATSSADQYALCVTLYEALCGRRPFDGSTIAELRKSAENDKVTFRGAQKISKSLQSAITRGLQPAPEDRYPSMKELTFALEESVSTRSRLWLAGGGALVVGAAALSLVWGGRSEGASPCTGASAEFARVWPAEQHTALEQVLAKLDAPYGGNTTAAISASVTRWQSSWVEESNNTCKATRIRKTQSEELMDIRMQCLQRGLSTFGTLTQELLTSSRPVLPTDFEEALPDVAACRDTQSLSAIAKPRPADVPEVEAIEALIARSSAQIATGAYLGALESAAEAHERAKALDYLPLVSRSALELARAHQKSGSLVEAGLAIEAAAVAALHSRSERVVIAAWIQAVAIYGEAGLYDKALRSAGYAEALFDRISEPGRLRAMLANNWGIVLYRMDKYAEAREQLERSYKLRLGLLGEENTLIARSLTNLGNLERASGNLPQALVHHRKALALDTRLLGEAHPEIGRHLHNVGGVLRLTDKREAIATYERALAVRRAALGARHQDVAITLNSLGLVHRELGEDERAKTYYLESLAAYPEESNPQRALSLHGLGVLAAKAGEHGVAQGHFREALSIFTKSFDDDHERVQHTLLSLSSSLLQSGDRARAHQLALRAQAAGNPGFALETGQAVQRSGLTALVGPVPRNEGGKKPAVSDKPASSDKPAASNKPVASDKPAANDKPAAGEKPAASDKPAAGEKPAAGDTPAANDKPALDRGMYGSSPAWD